MAHVMNASDRAIVNWEQGDPISPVYAAKLREIQSVYNELKKLMKLMTTGAWPAFASNHVLINSAFQTGPL